MKPTTIRERPAAEAVTTIVRKLSPTARMPSPTLVRGFGPAELELLEKRLQEPVECVYHPNFRRSTMPQEAEQRHATGPDVPPADPELDANSTPRVTEVLTAEQE